MMDTFAVCATIEHAIKPALRRNGFWVKHAHSDCNSRQRKALQKLLDADDGGFADGISAEKHGKITGAAKAIATRDLTDLLRQGALLSYGVGNATKYVVALMLMVGMWVWANLFDFGL